MCIFGKKKYFLMNPMTIIVGVGVTIYNAPHHRNEKWNSSAKFHFGVL